MSDVDLGLDYSRYPETGRAPKVTVPNDPFQLGDGFNQDQSFNKGVINPYQLDAAFASDNATVFGTETDEGKKSLEPDGKIDRKKGSVTTLKNDGTKNPGNLKALTAKDKLHKTSGTNYGRSGVGQEEDPSDKEANAQKIAKEETDKQVPKNLKSNNPTAASQDREKEIIEAVMAADPGNIAGSIQKALQAMMMIKMMDKLSSPAGIASMAAGAMGGGLGNLAKAVGTGAMLGGLGAAMPALQAALPGSQLGALNLGMQGMVSGNPVGALAAASVAAAADTVATLTGAAAVINPYAGINAAVKLGGPTLGLTPGDLAYRIALSTPGTKINTTALIRNVAVASTLEVVDSFIQDQLGNIPKLGGDEHISIATDHIPIMGYGVGNAMVGTLHEAGLIAGDVAGAYIGGAVKEITGDLANAVSGALGGGNIGGVLGNVMGGAIGGAISGGVAGIVDAGLNKLLGAPLSGMLGAVSSILPNIAGDILNNVAEHALTDGADAVQAGMKDATKALGLAAQGFKITNVFGPGLAEQVADMHDSMVAGVVKNAIAGAVQGAVRSAVAGALPTTMQTVCNGVRINVAAQVLKPGQAAVVGAIQGAFSQL